MEGFKFLTVQKNIYFDVGPLDNIVNIFSTISYRVTKHLHGWILIPHKSSSEWNVI